jgi:hypothetical protein
MPGDNNDRFHIICIAGIIILAAIAMFRPSLGDAKEIVSHSITALASLATGIGIGMKYASRQAGPQAAPPADESKGD